MCANDCCYAKVSAYTRRYVPTAETEEERKVHKKKAGVFVYDPHTDKLLLVQSCGRFWGPPKGSMEVGEDVQTAAARELVEETGLVLPKERLTWRLHLRNSSHHYFFYPMPENRSLISVQNPGANDANCVGWFRVSCLKQKLADGRMIGNAALKQFLAPGGPYERLSALALGQATLSVVQPHNEEDAGHEEGGVEQ